MNCHGFFDVGATVAGRAANYMWELRCGRMPGSKCLNGLGRPSSARSTYVRHFFVLYLLSFNQQRHHLKDHRHGRLSHLLLRESGGLLSLHIQGS